MSSMSSRAALKKLNSSITPNGPPSRDAPLSDRTRSSVSSSRPRASRKAVKRPTWSSVCSSIAANASCRRAENARWFAVRSLHLGTPGFGGASVVPGGTTPRSS
jgi:hypothetical protein